MKKVLITGMALAMLAIPATASADGMSNAHAKSVNNTNANANACWGQDRSFYASQEISVFDSGNMDIKQSFDPALGGVAEQKAAWVVKYC